MLGLHLHYSTSNSVFHISIQDPLLFLFQGLWMWDEPDRGWRGCCPSPSFSHLVGKRL